MASNSFSGPVDLPSLTGFYVTHSQEIQQAFQESRVGTAALLARSDLVDGILVRLYQQFIAPDLEQPRNICLLALGGYGRRELFPHSDLDLLFLTTDDRVQAAHTEGIAALVRMLWDLKMRVGSSTHTLAECGRLHRDNLEFNIALLDLRYLAGDLDLYVHLRNSVVPHLVARDRPDLVRDLLRLSAERRAKHGSTIFHLEPNLKEAPGCLRDFHVCRWLARIEELEKSGRWTPPEQLWPERDRAAASRAFDFLAASRCFLHYYYGRDENQLSYDAQESAAEAAVGVERVERLSPADWMRIYFRQVRSVDQLTAELVEDSAPARSGLYASYQDWRSRLSNQEFSVVRGRIFARHPSALSTDFRAVLSLFEMAARHGLPLARETERLIETEYAGNAVYPLPPKQLWPLLARILVQPYAAHSLRTMHRLRLLTRLFPEFQAIDSLVIRDYYHRYTVDEHTFLTIENLHALLREGAPRRRDRNAAGVRGTAMAMETWRARFAEILTEVERPELLYLALLSHDIGKGVPDPAGHVAASLRVLEGIRQRLALPEDDWQTVRFLVAQHLAMSDAAQHRDIFDPETVHDFARVVGNAERLKMLCLLTYADVCSVNPEAMTPWKAELQWQLYAATANYLVRSVDDERLLLAGEATDLDQILATQSGATDAQALREFLQGFPRRYTATHSPEQIAGHFTLARRKEKLALDLRLRQGQVELTVITADRPYLFASITGMLAAWGMSIVKADAFANAAGTILDTFVFTDPHRTFELNPSEHGRFRQNLSDVLDGTAQLEKLLSGRVRAEAAARKLEVGTKVRFDTESSSHSTLLELIAQDRPGLLYDVSSVLADHGCNIEVALIDTEGQRAIDVFYLTRHGAMLDDQTQAAVAESLQARL